MWHHIRELYTAEASSDSSHMCFSKHPLSNPERVGCNLDPFATAEVRSAVTVCCHAVPIGGNGTEGPDDVLKATARLATRGNSLIFHDAWFTKSWYLQGFVKTRWKRQIVVPLGPTTKSAFRVKRSSIFNTSETNYSFFLLLEKFGYIWPPVIEQHFFFNSPLQVVQRRLFLASFPSSFHRLWPELCLYMKALIWSSKRRSTRRSNFPRVRRLETTNCLRIFQKLSNSWVPVKSLFLGTFFTNCIRLCDAS